MQFDIVAYEEGKKAAGDGWAINACPYIQGSVGRMSWRLGFIGSAPDNYQMLALETWHGKDVPKNEQINHAMLQLTAEAGEVVKHWAKHMYKPDHEIDRDIVLDELGDLWYYVRIIAYLFDITIDELTQFNRQKLVDGHGWNGSDEKIKARMD